jgi:hypothetical protein
MAIVGFMCFSDEKVGRLTINESIGYIEWKACPCVRKYLAEESRM